MKKISLFMIVSLLLGAFLFTSCKEKDVTETQMIVRNWTLKSIKVLGNERPLTTCETGQKWNFKSDNTYAIYYTEACGKTTSTGNWELSSDAKKLTLDGKTFYEVSEITPVKMVIKVKLLDLSIEEWTFN